ncbi:unnamed protein product [Protopolystoma xenopodis]|uniref:Uncharacterized protein n=1 Tax=Protopolystoma xenopodis TaxID=117903 RepID=A0A448WG36_9PLAT|nr:unnamed protein product [Protopolystoma xenopodis]
MADDFGQNSTRQSGLLFKSVCPPPDSSHTSDPASFLPLIEDDAAVLSADLRPKGLKHSTSRLAHLWSCSKPSNICLLPQSSASLLSFSKPLFSPSASEKDLVELPQDLTNGRNFDSSALMSIVSTPKAPISLVLSGLASPLSFGHRITSNSSSQRKIDPTFNSTRPRVWESPIHAYDSWPYWHENSMNSSSTETTPISVSPAFEVQREKDAEAKTVVGPIELSGVYDSTIGPPSHFNNRCIRQFSEFPGESKIEAQVQDFELISDCLAESATDESLNWDIGALSHRTQLFARYLSDELRMEIPESDVSDPADCWPETEFNEALVGLCDDPLSDKHFCSISGPDISSEPLTCMPDHRSR